VKRSLEVAMVRWLALTIAQREVPAPSFEIRTSARSGPRSQRRSAKVRVKALAAWARVVPFAGQKRASSGPPPSGRARRRKDSLLHGFADERPVGIRDRHVGGLTPRGRERTLLELARTANHAS
jgi:hypothetical protein